MISNYLTNKALILCFIFFRICIIIDIIAYSLDTINK